MEDTNMPMDDTSDDTGVSEESGNEEETKEASGDENTADSTMDSDEFAE